MLALNWGVSTLIADNGSVLFTTEMWMSIVFLTGATLIAVYDIWNGAFIGYNGGGVRYVLVVIILGVAGVLLLPIGIVNLKNWMHSGQKLMDVLDGMPLIAGICCMAIFAAILIRILLSLREDDE